MTEFCWTDDHGCICGNECDPNPHNWHSPCNGCDRGCQWCAGGLETCRKCGAFEGATPDHCPGVMMQPDEADAVYAGIRNFRSGQWRNECAQAMRHIHDTVNYMAEHGYKPGPPHPISGNDTWTQV